MVSISYATLQNCAGASSDVNESIQLKNESVQFLSVGTSRSAHTSGKGCRKCTWGGYDCSKPGIVYYVRISHLGRYCYKIGVTNKSLKERYKNTDFNKINVDQSDINGDTLGDVCDDDMDNDGVPNIVELRFGGNQTDANDAATSLTNFALYAENAEADDDFDGFSNTIELAANTNPNDASDAPQAELTILEALSITKTVPAIGGIGLFVMFSSLIGLGFLKRKKN